MSACVSFSASRRKPSCRWWGVNLKGRTNRTPRSWGRTFSALDDLGRFGAVGLSVITDNPAPSLRPILSFRNRLLSASGSTCHHRVNAENRKIYIPLSTDAISAAFTWACKMLDIEDLHFHDLRHDGVSRLFEMGKTIPQAASVSGHRSW
jgi:hypothetical protein